MNTFERRMDIVKIIEGLDISPTMYKNAVDKYLSIAKYLEDHGVNADIYPQGSFAFGTVVRPTANSDESAYDLDFICQVRQDKEGLTAAQLRDSIQSILDDSKLYGEGKLEVFDECFRITYAEVNGVSFSIDIVPAADESDAKKEQLRLMSQRQDLIDTAIAIPKLCDKKYEWITNNPRGFLTWFDEINAPFKEYGEIEQRRAIFECNSHIYASIEEIPLEVIHSSVQRVIQILKYHRNVYYSRFEDGEETKPNSAIINTMVGKIAKENNPSLNIFELLEIVISEFDTYKKQLVISQEQFSKLYPSKNLITRKNDEWYIENPANPEDNLADRWNVPDSIIPKRFFKWLDAVKSDLFDALELTDEAFRSRMATCFREEVVKKAWGEKYRYIPPTPIADKTPAKPWRAE